jgi:hypothetical protein
LKKRKEMIISWGKKENESPSAFLAQAHYPTLQFAKQTL